jgi:probable F420-dependent oxidoreductase
MKFAIAFANVGPFVDPHGALSFARGAEAAGFESVWTVEHVVVPAGYRSTYPYDPSGRMPGDEDAPIPDPLVWLSFIASATTTLRLGTGILILPQRHPVVLAKEVASLDHLSSGRMALGIGAGWLAEEFQALGIPYEERGERTDDAVGALRALWEQDVASYEGRYTSFERCLLRPRPVRGTVPIHVGGHTEAAARRAGRLGDGFFPAVSDHDRLRHLFAVAKESAAEAGRDPEALELTTGGGGAVGSRALDEVAALAEMGVERVVLPSFLFFSDTEAALARYGEEVIDQVEDSEAAPWS